MHSMSHQSWHVPAQIKYLHSGKCLDVPRASQDSHVRLELWDCHGLDHQLFSFTEEGRGWYSLRPKHSTTDKCVEVGGERDTNGQSINGQSISQWVSRCR